MSTKVHPLSAEKSAEYCPSAPAIESYAHLTPMPITEILAKQQRRLEEWDRDLSRREHALAILKAPKKVIKNWPKIFPVIYHDISIAIPIEYQTLIQLAYWTWKLTATAYVFNWFLLTIALISGFGSVSFIDWSVATVTVGCGISLSFQMAYYPLYRATEEGELLDSICWRFHMTCAIAWSVLMVIGVPLFGHVSAGLWLVVSALKSDSDVMGLACFSNSLLWIVVFVFQCIVFREVKRMALIEGIRDEENHYKQGS
eukprot:g8692.t1